MSLSKSLRMMALASAAVVLPAQESTRLAGPTSGLVYDAPSRALRVVMGVPGAAYLGGALVNDLEGGSPSPDGRFALALSSRGVALVTMADQSVAWMDSAGCAAASQVAWSKDGSAVAAACADGTRLYRAGQRVALGAGVDGVRGLAVDASGTAVFAARSNGVYRIDASEARLIAQLDNPSGLALAGGTLYAVDRAGKRVIAIDQLDASASVRQVAGEAQGLVDPVAAGVSADGQRLFVAEGGETPSLLIFNIATLEALARLDLEFEPSRVDALGNGLFLLKSRREAGDTVQVFDSRQLAVFFVPAQDLGSVANLED